MKRVTQILLTLLSFSCGLQAKVTVIRSGETVTSTVTITPAGDGVIVEERGTIFPLGSGDNGIELTANNQTALNQGTIDVFGIANGINTVGDNVTITNDKSGRITSTSLGAAGIVNLSGASAVITNRGTITLQGGSNAGIFNSGANAMITNSGTIGITLGADSYGIHNSSGANAVITNNGAISVGIDSFGIYNLSSSNVSITNNRTATILALGSGARGINNVTGNNAVITNSGIISASGSGAIGINSTSSTGVRINNAGIIRSAQSDALNLGNSHTLSLLRGSLLEGTVSVGSSFTLIVERGLNLFLTLGSGGFDSLDVSMPFVQVGSTIATIDPTGLAMQADVAADLSDTLLDGLYRHRFGCCKPCGCGPWTELLGSYRKRSHGDDAVGYENWQGGFLIGYDAPICSGNLSLFGGISFAKAEVDQITQRADINNYVGGLSYETRFCGTFLGLAMAAGYVSWDNQRFVMNNLAADGVESARADIDGFFLSPDITLVRQLNIWCHPILSLNVRYAGLFLGNYDERGSGSNLTVKDREIDLITPRLEAAIPYSSSWGSCCWSVEPYVGGFGRFQVGGYRVDGELLGQSLQFDQEGPKNLAAFLLGFRGTQTIGRCHLFVNLEASFDSASSQRILGEGGLSWSY
ncbi:MAG: hypothetical protein KR126chlam2_00508 [Chlamydiae bacterium]|nr:hypothetical protein [Chlamydiota bacterium]